MEKQIKRNQNQENILSRVLIEPIITEAATASMEKNKYIFKISARADKSQVKAAIEKIYKVKVTSVNTQVNPGKLKRVRYQIGKTPDWKKAVVTLKEGQKIDLA